MGGRGCIDWEGRDIVVAGVMALATAAWAFLAIRSTIRGNAFPGGAIYAVLVVLTVAASWQAVRRSRVKDETPRDPARPRSE